MLQVTETLCDLVRIPSVNPMGRPFNGEEFLEHRVTEYLRQLFERLHLRYECQQIEDKRANIVARLDGDTPPEEGGRLIAFEAHQDTVPVDGMTIPPWTPEIKQGRIYGRGSCDIKGGMAAMLAALSQLANERPPEMPTILMACSVNEEHGFSGASDMAAHWQQHRSTLVPRVPDAVIVAEPTLLNVVVAHKGVVRWCCHTRGRAAHSSTPELGDNAIYRMGQVLQHLQRYAQDILPQQANHRWVGRPTLSVGIIHGGISVNTVPDSCTIEIDRRVLPGEDAALARQQVLDYVAEQLGEVDWLVHDPAFIAANGLSDERNTELAGIVSQASQQHGGPGELIGVPYGTDAPAFDGVGAPTVVFGPGSIDQAHTCDEWVEIAQLETAVKIYCKLATRLG